MKLFKYTLAWMVCILLLLGMMCGCSDSTEPPTTPPTVPPTEAPTEPEGFRIAKDTYSGSDITEFTVDDITKYIDEGAFANCSALENFYCAPKDVIIDENAFTGTNDVVFHCYLNSTADIFAREHDYDRLYFDAFSLRCDTVKNGCVGLPITWSAVDVMPGQDIVNEFIYSVYFNDELIFTSEPTAEEHFVYTPTLGGQYSISVQLVNELTTASLTSDVVPVAEKLIMGLFEQDDEDADPEPIEWRILTVEDGKALVLSEYILTKGSYFNPEWIKYKYTYWAESCIGATSSINYWGSKPESDERRFYDVTPDSVPQGWFADRGPEADIFYVHSRYWCNEVFYKEHLTEEEQARVLLSNLSNPDNPRFHTAGGPDSQDYVFFLNYEEVEKYMPTREDRKAYMTTFTRNIPLQYGTNDSYYWLRSPGENSFSAMIIWGGGGIITYTGNDVGHNNVGYRPAMWITVGG